MVSGWGGSRSYCTDSNSRTDCYCRFWDGGPSRNSDDYDERGSGDGGRSLLGHGRLGNHHLGTVETKERRPGYEATFVIRLYIDGEQQAEKEVTISGGDRETVTFSHTFDSSGEHAVTVEAEAKGATPYRDS